MHLHSRKSHKKCPCFSINCYMVMGEKLSMLKCEPNHIHHKGFLLVFWSLMTKKINVMIQMHDEKTMLKKVKLANLLTMNHFQFMVLAYGLHFFFPIRLGGFKILIVNIPCKLKRHHITNLTHLICFIKIIILLNSWKCITWDKPHPPHGYANDV